jgi:hypothetical protein
MGLHAFLVAHTLSGRIEQNKSQLIRAQRLRQRRHAIDNAALNGRVEALEDDLGYISLVLASIMCRLDEKGVVTQDDVRSLVAELDDVDGVSDGKLDVNLLKELTSE